MIFLLVGAEVEFGNDGTRVVRQLDLQSGREFAEAFAEVFESLAGNVI